ncbi:MAG: phospho-N-acetylmuramoyl-pentapeptide-transferase [Armatimonadota bacterium]
MPSFLYTLIAAMALAFLVTFITAPLVIGFLRRKKLGQQIREDGPQRHQNKAGTPTMGGVVILAGVIAGTALSTSLFWRFSPHLPNTFKDLMFALLLLALTIAVASIGAIDDWGKIRRGRSLGLRAREKLILQFIASGLFVAGLVLFLDNGTSIGIPGLKEPFELGWVYWPIAILLIAGMSNAVNLTDGLDGLAAGTTVAAAFAMTGIAWFAGQGEVMLRGHAIATFIGCLGAACLAFLWFNQHPAKVFMGDTGSLAIGAALAGTALALKQEILLLVLGFIFLIEMGSVIIQVISFKTTGKRIFRMSPFHHHLELGGWSEPRIVTSAWLFGIVLAVAAFVIFRKFGM